MGGAEQEEKFFSCFVRGQQSVWCILSYVCKCKMQLIKKKKANEKTTLELCREVRNGVDCLFINNQNMKNQTHFFVTKREKNKKKLFIIVI